MFTVFGYTEKVSPDSSAIKDVYFASNGEVVIVFTTGYASLFKNVKREDFNNLVNARSAGRHYNDVFAYKYQSVDRVLASKVNFLDLTEASQAPKKEEVKTSASDSKDFTIEFQLNGNAAKHVVQAVDALQAMGVFNALVKGFGGSVTDKKVVFPFG